MCVPDNKETGAQCDFRDLSEDKEDDDISSKYCNYNQYCDEETGTCQSTLNLKAKCKTDEQCGYGSACVSLTVSGESECHNSNSKGSIEDTTLFGLQTGKIK